MQSPRAVAGNSRDAGNDPAEGGRAAVGQPRFGVDGYNPLPSSRIRSVLPSGTSPLPPNRGPLQQARLQADSEDLVALDGSTTGVVEAVSLGVVATSLDHRAVAG